MRLLAGAVALVGGVRETVQGIHSEVLDDEAPAGQRFVFPLALTHFRSFSRGVGATRCAARLAMAGPRQRIERRR